MVKLKFKFYDGCLNLAKMILTFVLMGILALAVIAPANFADAKNNKVNVLIGFHGIPDDSLVKGKGGEIKKNFHPFINVIAANIPEAAINGLMKNPNVSFVEEDAIATIQGHSTSANEEYVRSWGVNHIDADVVHQIPNSGTGIKVAVIDTGVNYNHNDLSANYHGGIDFVNDDDNPMDDHGHGSHVSGILAAVANDAGVIGTAPEVWIYGVKVLSSGGSGSYSDVISGIQWSSNNGMNIASLSLGGGASQALCAAVTAAYNNYGVLVIAAAGNSGNPPGKGDNVLYPANCADAMAVAATNQDDNRASFSSTGPQVEISAPGVSIYSTHLGQNYKTFSGTSMATPHVSGVAALVFASGTYSSQEVRTILQQTANDLGPSGRDSKYGFGLVDPVEAVGTDPGSGEIIVPPPSTGTNVSVHSVTYDGEGGKNKDKHLLITVNLVDDSDDPVSGANISIDLLKKDTSQLWKGSGTTGSNGSVTFTLKNAPAGCYTTTVTSISAGSLTWNGSTPPNEGCK